MQALKKTEVEIAAKQAEYIQTPNARRHRYLLTQVILTNGHELQVRVFDLDTPKSAASAATPKNLKKDKGELPDNMVQKAKNGEIPIVGIDFGQVWFAAFIRKDKNTYLQQHFKMKVC